MTLRVGLIGGTGLYTQPGAHPIELETPHGPVELWHSRRPGVETFFLPRHGPDHRHVPLRVPHRAHILALRAARCEYIVGVNNVGSLRPDLRPGSWVVPGDFLDLHHANRHTLHPDEPVHADFTRPYCPTLQRRLRDAFGAAEATYVGVDGPRFETPAEVRWFASIGGDVVGMTGVPEAILAREAGLCYASLCFVGNHATGLGKPLDPKAIQRQLASNQGHLERSLRSALRGLDGRRSDCGCRRVNPSLRRRGGS